MRTPHFVFFLIVLTLAVISAAFSVLGPNSIGAQGIDRTISFQGKLLTSSGIPVADGTYSFKFSIYDAASGGNRLWTASGTLGTPTSISVPVTNGLFTVRLGDVNAGQNPFEFDWYRASLYLGVSVQADAEMAPRKQLSSVPYAFVSENVQGQFTSGAVASTGGALFSLRQTSTSSATGDRTVLYVSTSGTSDVYDYLIKGSDGVDVFTVSREGHTTTTGDFVVEGDVVLGDASADTVIVNAGFASNVLPSATNVYDLGSVSSSWKDVYASGTAYVATDVVVSGSSVCLEDGTNCPPAGAEADTLLSVTNRGNYATSTV
ncbi:MAG: hypothetical protein L0213_15140, partial [Candidatus Dadabacteria bacterium]|nr:hypothetical protein [Candidatus Dadabacteria bacterium]